MLAVLKSEMCYIKLDFTKQGIAIHGFGSRHMAQGCALTMPGASGYYPLPSVNQKKVTFCMKLSEALCTSEFTFESF